MAEEVDARMQSQRWMSIASVRFTRNASRFFFFSWGPAVCTETDGFPVFTGRTTSPKILVRFDWETVIDVSSIAGQLLPKNPSRDYSSPTTHPWLSRAKEKAECLDFGGREYQWAEWNYGKAGQGSHRLVRHQMPPCFFLELLMLASRPSFSFFINVSL